MAILKLLSGTIFSFFLISAVHCQLTCNFEVDTCQWYWSNGWIRSRGKASNLDTGPVDDRTNPDGFYLHLNASHYQPNEKAYIFSPPILDTKKKYCLSFFYLMHGKQVATLSVHVLNFSSSTEVWATSFEHGPEWLRQEVSIKNGHQVKFEGVFGGELGDIAIDDIKMTEGECLVEENEASPPVQLPTTCTFEGNDLCGYHNKYFSHLRWLRGSGITFTYGSGPDKDHTYGTKKGHYMFLKPSFMPLAGLKAIVISPRYSTKSDACVQFWYNMYGTRVNKLNVYVKKHLKWSKQGSQGYGWRSAFVYISGFTNFKLKFEAVSGSGTKGDVAIDDISIQKGKCPPPVDCSFENTLCAWSNTGNDDTDWLPRTGKHPPGLHGPITDHTLGSAKGTYMVIISNPSLREGDRARFVSTTITETVKTHCLRFWYSMSGKNVGELRVIINTQTLSSPVWRLIGPQGSNWAFAAVPIYPRRENFWFVIEGVIGKPSNAYIAIDDISLVEGTCKTAPDKASMSRKTVTTVHPIKSTTPFIVNPNKKILSCHFDKNFCDWRQGQNDKADWLWTNLATPSLLTGPNRDHTTGKGGFIYVEASNGIVGPIRLFSRTIKPIHENMCLKFWYFMFGRDIDTLRVFISPGTHFDRDMNPHWKKSGSKPEKWFPGKLFFQMKHDFQIVFQATLNGGFGGDIALDDISLTYGACDAGEEITTPKPGITEKPIPIDQRNCDFESKDICGYEHAKGSPKYYWRRNSGRTDTRMTGPSVDHTTNSPQGHYMYIEGVGHKTGTVARMITPLYQDATNVCLQFYYHMYGTGIGNLNIYILSRGSNNDSQQIYSTTGDHGINWEVGRVTIDKWTAIAGYKIMFEATVGKNNRTDIALDDVSFSAGKCPSLGDCNFEDDSCTWKNIKSDDFDWVLRSGKTPTPQTGPEFDHTFRNNKGHYMYIETSPPIKPGMKAQLASTLLPRIDKNMCLEFWYNMYGKTVGSLKVILLVTGFHKTVLWHLEGNQGKNWLYARLPLRNTATTYTLFFEASSGTKYTGDIAIDDISFTENKCQILPANAQVKTTAAPYKTTPVPTKSGLVSGNFTCNFDNDLCGWKQDRYDSNQWYRKIGPTSTRNTGPPGDHTTGSGSYIYLETTRQRPGSFANLISPTYKPDKTGINCVSFWYYMYGAHVKSLSVYIQYGQMIPRSPTWIERGNKGQKWIMGKFSFPSNAVFNVILSAVVGLSYDGDIAVDDVTIINGDCVDYITNTYLTCDFENTNLCGFTQGTTHTYDWKWNSGRTPSFNSGPSADHTFGTSAGHYMYIKGARPRGYSRLLSPAIHTTYTSCVHFYYHMKGHVGELYVFLSARNYIGTLWRRSGHQSHTWQLATFEVESNFTSYNLMFEARFGGNSFGDMAIDDFSMVKGKCSNQGHCDFEKGMCIWQNSKDDDFDWIIKKADRNSKATNPVKDHSQSLSGSEGHFLYVSTDHNPLHAKAQVETTDFEPGSKDCLRFWFNGYGHDPGTFTVRFQTEDRSQPLWQLTGTNVGRWPKNGKWHEARVRIPKTTKTFTISIDVVVGTSGYVAVDDIVFDKEKDCSRMPGFSKPIIPKIPSTIPTTPVPTTPKKSIPSVSCHFSNDFCGWTQDKKNDIDWLRINKSTSTYETGPSADHTTGSGYYIYIESSEPTKKGDIARLISPKITLGKNRKRCLTFWYCMYGETIGTLSLHFLVNGKMSAPVWKRQKSQGKNWKIGRVNLEDAQLLQVVFEASSGNGYFGDIALDDIFLHGHSCHSIEATPLPSCDFEGTCNYKTVTNQHFIPWIKTSLSNHPNITDHTYDTLSGEFIYANMTGAPMQYIARVETPALKPGQYCLEFFYHPINNFNGDLYVYSSSHRISKRLFFKHGFLMKNQWTIGEAGIKESKDFTVLFETRVSRKIKGTIAMDDIVFKNGVCPNPGSCDFERGNLCFWTNDPANQVDWIVHNGPTRTPRTGPSSDHTKGTKAGMYALLESSHPAKPGYRARLISQPLSNNNVKSCFHFWYTMKGSQVANLSISIISATNIETTYWRFSGHQGNSWYQGQIPLPAAKLDFLIVIEASVGGKFGDIAIDDLFVSENGCGFFPKRAQVFFPTTIPSALITTTNAPIISGDKTFNCTFEKGTCGWVQSQTDDFDWIRNRGYTPTKETGPQGDHTTGGGYYMFMEASGSHHAQNAELVFNAANMIPGLKCMQFWYSMHGSHVGHLNIYIISEVNKQSPVWTQSGTQGPKWNLAKVEFNATEAFKVIIEGVRSYSFMGDIAIDDVTLLNEGCKEPYGDCDFETRDLCGYKNDPTGNFTWTVRRGRTSSILTGPKSDHTYRSYRGHYIYIESSPPRKQNDTARIISPVYKALPDEHCLQFYYNMYGADVGELNVKIRIHDSETTTYDTDNYLQIEGEQGEDWILAQVELPKLVVENPYQLIFEGVVGTGSRGDIAIDDIVINYGQCEIGGDCDFDNGPCTWVNVRRGDSFDWIVGSGATSTTGTGPVTDHTKENSKGFYLFIDASIPRIPGQKAWYVSQNFPPTFGQRRCITFWYSMNGMGVGILRVVIKFETGGNNTLWELNRDQGNDWQFGQAPIQSPTHYKIIFEGVRGPDDRGDIAIDDILFTDFSCSVKPTLATPRGKKQTLPSIRGTTPAAQGNNAYLHLRYKQTRGDNSKSNSSIDFHINYKRDKENNIIIWGEQVFSNKTIDNLMSKSLNCTFDFGMCGWTQDTKDDFDWRENRGPTFESETGPMKDHNSNGTGYYLYIPSQHFFGKKARLISPLILPNGLQCFTVWYHMHGSDIAAFNVYIFTGPKLPHPSFHRYGTKGNKWLRADIQFNAESPYNVILEAYSNRGLKSEIAIDDVSIVNGHCHTVSVNGAQTCDFENNDICHFIQDTDDDFDWIRNNHRGQVSLSDHTYGSRSGHFMFVRRLPYQSPDKYASLSTPVYTVNSKDLCVEFWYYMNGEDTGTLAVSYATDKDNYKSAVNILTRTGSKEGRWLQVLSDIDVSQIKHIQIKFYGNTGQRLYGLIGLDDVKISSQACKRHRGDCNFEKDNCNWINADNDDFDWTIGSGFTTTSKSGPIKDHTLGTQAGSYLYIEPESTNSKKIAILQSETLDESQNQCLQFYYYMKGATDGSLEILLNPGSRIWHLESHQSDNWTLAQIHLPVRSMTYQVKIRGSRGPRFEGQIAIDDVRFLKKFPCKTLPPKATLIPTTTSPITTTSAPIVGFECTFDQNMCGWQQNTHSKFKWSRQRGLKIGPSSDHTGGGYFLYIDSSNMIPRLQASLVSPNLPLTIQRCLSFYYYMAGEDLDILSVGYRNLDDFKIFWKREGPQGNQWNHATVNLPVNPFSQNGTIELTGIGPQIGASGFIAIDDITLYSGNCKRPEKSSKIDCDFENSQLCGYKQESRSDFDWNRTSGENKLKKQQPDADHTYRTSHGHYMYLNSAGNKLGRSALLWSPKFAAKKDSCLTFWYRMSGAHIGMLKVRFSKIRNYKYRHQIVWMRRGDQGNNWNQEYITINQDDNIFVLFEGESGIVPGGIAIDDVKLMPSCAEPGDCTFETDSCGWHNAVNNDLDWQRLMIKHITMYRHLPIQDHTESSSFGHYMFFTSRNYVNPGKKADLLSVSFDPTSETGLCFEFWFIIFGYNYGSLTVFKQSNSTERTAIWHLSQTKGKVWTRASFHVKSFEPYQISFRAVKGNGSAGSIAIDDINYSAIFCTVTPGDARIANPSTTLATTVKTTTTGPTKPPSPYDCTFEEGFCKWTQAKNDDFDWKIGTGSTDTDDTGPLSDHTLGNLAGHYMYIDSSFPRRPNQTARLVSPMFSKIFIVCVTFWYHMYGEDVDSLNVYTIYGTSRTLVWSHTGTLNRKWYQGSVLVFPRSHSRIIIEGTRGKSYKGDIAVDDIKIYSGACPRKANLCSFDDGRFCNYKQVGSDDFDWSVGSSVDAPYLPRKDHTVNSALGKFMYVNGNHKANTTTQILGPVMDSSVGSCVRFWYNLNGSIMLNVYMVSAGEQKMLNNYQEKTDGKWTLGLVDIKSTSTWEVMFEAKISQKSPTSYLAIDDIQSSVTICGTLADCSFEYGFCYWRNQIKDDFDWVVKKAEIGRTGPKIDHTLQNHKGSYLFIEGSSPQKPGDKAILNSPTTSRNSRCLKFWYSMHEGVLEVHIKQRVRSVLLWRVRGPSGKPGEWKYAQVPFKTSMFYRKFQIVGTIGSGSKSYIALDDIIIQTSSCSRFPAESDPRYATLPPTQPSTTRASFVPHSIYDCSFELGFCSWNQSKEDDFDWKRAQGPTKAIATGPNKDHTIGTELGWYIYIESSTQRNPGDTSILVSPLFKNGIDYCFSFYYYIYGSTLGKLSVIMKTVKGSNLTLWAKNENQGQIWLKEAFRIPKQNLPFTIFLQGDTGSGIYGDIAIDDIQVYEGGCLDRGPLNCTFESIYLCGYKTPENKGVKWNKHSFRQGSLFGPKRDHSLSSDGTYMFLELHAVGQTVGQAQLVSPVIRRSPDLCMTFYYQMEGNSAGYFSVYQQIGNTTDSPIWIHWKISPSFWNKGQITVPAQDNYRIIFEGRLESNKSSIMIDDISTVPGLCPEPGNCNFDEGMCMWNNMKDVDIYWNRVNGKTPTENTGPTTDHTKGTDAGYYLFIEATNSKPYHSAKLRSMSFPPTTARCIHFWYHMYGRHIGGLNIHFVDVKTQRKTSIWYLSGNQDNKWQYAQVAYAYSDIYYILIEGTVGIGRLSDIAIDDISFSQDYCGTTPVTAKTKYVFPRHSTTPPPTWSPTSFDCNFEQGLCSWQQGKNDDFDWLMNFGPTPSRRTGPTTDHTLKTKYGHYVYIESRSSRRPFTKAHLESPSFIPTQTGCLQFWYFMYGPDIGTLTVYMKNKGNLTAIWTKSGTADPAWHQALVPIHSDDKIQIVLEGRKGAHWIGDIAIDDIAFSFKGCKTTNDMTCGFEDSNICGFTQSKSDSFDWKWMAPHFHVKRQMDHTFGTRRGHYMLVSGSNYHPGQKGILVSPTYSSKISKCIEFWYYMSKEKAGSLYVSAVVNETQMKLWGRSGKQGDVWSLGQMTVHLSGNFHIEIEAIADSTAIDISIDDFGLFEGECPKPGNCDFEKGWCTWNNKQMDDFDWQIGTGYLGMFGAPHQDHTTESVKGQFIFLPGDYRLQKGSRAVLLSEVFDGTYHDCMQFWYYMSGAGTGTINIYTLTSGSKNLSWTLTGEQPYMFWSPAQFPVHHNQKAFKILIEGIKGESSQINIAIDDIFFSNDNCRLIPSYATAIPPTMTSPIITSTVKPTPVPTPFDCTFEDGMCLWKQDKTDKFDWIRSQGPMGSNVTGPIYDHTHGTNDGWYIFTDISEPRLPFDKSRLIGPIIQASQDRCFNFWYHMHGSYISTLSVILSINGTKETKWTKSGDQGDAWWEASFNLAAFSNTTYQVIFEGSREVLTNGEIAIDDVRFTKNKCQADNPTYCDFEDGLCNYTQVKNDDFDWNRTSGSTPTFLTGPSSDHSTGTKYGHYLFIDTSDKKPNQKAQLMSPKYNSNMTTCLHFYYHMYGNHIDELNVYRVDGNHIKEIGNPIWSRKYNQGDHWLKGQTTISPGNDYHIIFEGKVGKDLRGNIAIDDIYQTKGACQPPGFCDFEKDMCTWKNIKSDQFDWLRGKGYSDTPQTGPSSDHTLRNPEGHYVYIETSDPQAPGNAARLQSTDFLPSNISLCLRFWYQMNGEDVNTLNVLVQNINEKGEGYLWTQKGNKGPEWLNAQLNVDTIYTNKPYYLLFEGIRGDGFNGDIAIDDIEVSHGKCALMPEYADPKQIALSKVECDFENHNICNWQQTATKDKMMWKIASGRLPIYNTGPKEAHSGSTYYIYSHNRIPKKGVRSGISSPILGPTSRKGNCFTFYYNMYGMQIGTLNVYTVVNGNKTLHWTKSGDQGDNWNHAHFTFNSKFNYQIYIERVSTRGYYDVIALDDLSMERNPCSPTRVCDFDLDLCGWTNEKYFKPWLHSMSVTPIPDHSTGTTTGGFLYSNSTIPVNTLTAFRMITPSYPPATKSCLKFWYLIAGHNPGSLNVYVKLPYTEKRIWSREGHQDNVWWQAHVNVGQPEVSITQPYNFVFEAMQKPGPTSNGVIVIDDVEHLPGPCSDNRVCDFEQDICGFNNIKGDDFDWIRGKGKTDSTATGPLTDHTLKSPKGYYMFIEASGVRAGQKALLASWVEEKTTGSCFKFWYNMYGHGMGTLNVYMYTPTGSKRLWSKSGNQGQQWLSASITVVSKEPLSIVFEAVRGVAYASDIAIDDISYLDGSCEEQTTPSTVGLITQPPTPASMFRCDFENGFCGWKQDNTENADWVLTMGLAKSEGPSMDHTKDNKMGRYIMVHSSSMNINRTARLMSDPIFQEHPVCLTFWYHMHGGNPGTLNVYIKNIGEKKDAVWTTSGDKGMAWRYVDIEIAKPEKENKIYFEAIRGGGYGDISLDDIDLLLDNCPPRDFCDFEEPDVCGYEQGDTDAFDWSRGSGETPTFNSGPKNDHTYNSKYGHYMYITTHHKNLKDNRAHLYSPVYPATTQERCLTFWYNMNGKDVARLNVYIYQNNHFGDQIWSLQMNQGPHWHLATVPVNSEIPFQIVFEGIQGKGSMGDIAIDDVKLSKEVCDPVAFCTFEESICGWENLHDIGGADFDWQRIKGSVPPRNLGPSIDHTIGDQSGYYMLANAIHWKKGQAARLKSQMIPLIQNNPISYCFHFWYVVYGANIGELKVEIAYHADISQILWRQTSLTKSKWTHGMVHIDHPYSHFEIILVAVVGTGNRGYIAVDDLQLQPGICPNMTESKFTCKSGEKISTSKVCDFLHDCPDFDDEENCGGCFFEDDMCTWQDRSTGAFAWTRIQGRSNKTFSKMKDHTMKTDKGWFALVTSSSKGYGRVAVLQNRVLQQTSSTCQLKFWYYITGSYITSLTLGILEGGRTTKLWEKVGSHGAKWNVAIVDIGKISRPFKLQFLADTFYGNKGNIAVDDIELQNCNFPEPEENCARTEFQCQKMGCVDKSRVCDLSDDCGDRSDEIGCQNYTSCDFENSLCEWSQDTDDDFDWMRHNEPTLTANTGPSRDHSKGTGSGYYIYAESSRPRKKGDKARLASAVIEPTSDKCWIRFFYHMNGMKMGTLNVYIRTTVLGSYRKVWTKSGNVGDVWEKANVKLSSDQVFQVVFEADINGASSDMALDDITLTPECHLADPKIHLPKGTVSKSTPSLCDGLFQCEKSGCIQLYQVCDFTNDCKDGSDEKICGTCNFESIGNCGWKDRSNGRFKWQSHQGDSPGKYGPINDHTSGSDIGKYMMVLGSYGVFRSHAILETRPFSATAGTCQAEFYVFMLGEGVGEISLNLIDPVTRNVTKQVVKVTGNQGGKWKRFVGNIGAQPAGFALQFEALPNVQRLMIGSTTDMAIDDVKLMNCKLVTTKKPPTKGPIQPNVSTKKANLHTKPPPSTTTKKFTITSTTTNNVIPEVTSTPKGPKLCGRGSFSCSSTNDVCLPSAFRCDGNADCPDNSDEKFCETCPKGQTYCIPKQQCISSHRCDGIVDCPDGSDESACKECQNDFCLNGGTCTIENGSPKCHCKDKDANFRCLVAAKSKSHKKKTKKALVIALGSVLSLVIAAVIFAVIYFTWAKKSENYSPERQEGINNPTYDYGSSLPTEFGMHDLEPAFQDEVAIPSNPTSIENPLYYQNGNHQHPELKE